MIFPSKKYKLIDKFYNDYVSILNIFLKKVDGNSLVKVSNLILKALKKNSRIFSEAYKAEKKSKKSKFLFKDPRN